MRWLRPAFQAPEIAAAAGVETARTKVAVPIAAAAPAAAKSRPWPKALPEQVQAVRELLAAQAVPASAECIARGFARARADRVTELLDTLVAIGHVRALPDGTYMTA